MARRIDVHVVIPIIGLGLTGAQEARRLTDLGFSMDGYAESCLLNEKSEYDAKHRLTAGECYQVVLVPINEIKRSERTTANLQRRGELYGYSRPLAGIVPRILETVSNRRMREMGIRYIVAPDPISGPGGIPIVLGVNCCNNQRRLCAGFGGSDRWWRSHGAAAFLLPAST